MTKPNATENMPVLLKIHGGNIKNLTFNCKVVGTTFVENSDQILRYVKNKVKPQDIILIPKREKDNTHDPNAVRIYLTIKGSKKSYPIGYFPKDHAVLISYVLDHANQYELYLKNISLYGGDKIKTYIGVFFSYNIVDTLAKGEDICSPMPKNLTKEDLDNIFKD